LFLFIVENSDGKQLLLNTGLLQTVDQDPGTGELIFDLGARKVTAPNNAVNREALAKAFVGDMLSVFPQLPPAAPPEEGRKGADANLVAAWKAALAAQHAAAGGHTGGGHHTTSHGGAVEEAPVHRRK
jgi:hypothetical protein